jgi:membrane fusion protein (multidrug efflux system)
MRLAPYLGVVLLVACAAEEAGTKEEKPPTKVDAAPVVEMEIERTLSALGSLRAHERVGISVEIPGIVESIHFQEGDRVEIGEGEAPVLFRLDRSLLDLEVVNAEALLAVAEADLEQKKATYLRKKKMYEGDATTEAAYTDARLEMDRAMAAKSQAEAALGIALERQTKAVIRAPISGILTERSVSPGDYVMPGQPLVEIVSADPVEVSFSIPERHQAELRAGLAIICTTDALPGETFRGEVFYVAPDGDPMTRTILLKARIPNPDLALKPGVFARVILVVGEAVRSLVVPEEAIVPRGEKFFVYLVQDGQARMQEVALGQRIPGKVAILEGLSGTETVITAGLQKVSDGFAVEVRGEE